MQENIVWLLTSLSAVGGASKYLITDSNKTWFKTTAGSAGIDLDETLGWVILAALFCMITGIGYLGFNKLGRKAQKLFIQAALGCVVMLFVTLELVVNNDDE